jgi:hypothetical protein
MLETRVAVAKASSPAGSDGVSPANPLPIVHQLFQLAPSDGETAVAALPKKPAVLGGLAVDRAGELFLISWTGATSPAPALIIPTALGRRHSDEEAAALRSGQSGASNQSPILRVPS